jgi:hypothetical protein
MKGERPVYRRPEDQTYMELALEQAAESLAIAEEAKENAQIKYDDALLAYSAAELNTLRGELELLEKRAEELQEKQEAEFNQVYNIHYAFKN